jgi:hypothetical protein
MQDPKEVKPIDLPNVPKGSPLEERFPVEGPNPDAEPYKTQRPPWERKSPEIVKEKYKNNKEK